MPVTAEELVRLLAILAEEENLKVTVKETLKGGAMAGAGAVIGGMCGGPVGLAVGAGLGGAYARWKYKGKADLVSEILISLEADKREDLHEHCKEIIDDYSVHDFTAMSKLLSEDGELRERMLQSLKSYVTETLKRPLYEEIKQRGKAE